MGKTERIVVLVAALLSLFAVVSSSAGAATWHNSGSTSLHATAGPFTISATSGSFACPAGGTVTGTVAATPAIVPVGNWTAVTSTVTWTGCTLGVSGYFIECGLVFTASTWAVGPPAVTNGLADMTCGMNLAGTKFCVFEGTVNGHYINPVSPSTPGRLTLTTGGNLTVTNGSGASTCPLGNGDLGHLSEITFSVTSFAGSPIITRT